MIDYCTHIGQQPNGLQYDWTEVRTDVHSNSTMENMYSEIIYSSSIY